MATKLLLSIEDAAEMIGVKRTTTYQLIRDGELESVKIGRSRKIPYDALEEFVARLRADAGTDAA